MYQTFIEKTLATASDIARTNFGKVAGVAKGDDRNQVLTETDIAIGEHIVGNIKHQFPEHNIIDEELGITDNGSSYTWVVDPIDGTSNFAVGVPCYGVMIGLLHHDIPVAGGISLPSLDETYLAEQGSGTYRNGEKVSVSRVPELENSLVSYGIDGHPEKPEITRSEVIILAEIVLGIRNLRTTSSAFDFVQVINGSYGAGLHRTSKIWDVVAPHILVQEAGGIVTDFFGNEQDFANPLTLADNNFTWCGGAPQLHEQLQRIIQHCSTTGQAHVDAERLRQDADDRAEMLAIQRFMGTSE